MSRKRGGAAGAAPPPHPVFRGNTEDESIPPLDLDDENIIGMTMSEIMELGASRLCTAMQYILKRKKARVSTGVSIQSVNDIPALAEEMRTFLRVTIEKGVREKELEAKALIQESLGKLESDLASVKEELAEVKASKVELEQKLNVYKRRLLDAKMKLSAASSNTPPPPRPASSASGKGKAAGGKGKGGKS